MSRPVYTKAIIAAVGAVSTWGITAASDGVFDSVEWFTLLGALATAVSVYAVANGQSPDSDTSTPDPAWTKAWRDEPL